RPERLHFTTVQLPALLDTVIELYANEIETKQTTVIRDYARDVPTVYADENAIYRAFLNLIVNALDAMGPRGQLTLRIGWAEGATRRAYHRRVRIEIEDTGAGIPPAERDLIFNPFYTTKEGVTGLGLALTHKIIEEHRGTIDVASTPGVGSTFRVVLPVVPDTPPIEDAKGGRLAISDSAGGARTPGDPGA